MTAAGAPLGATPPLLEARGIVKHFPVHRGLLGRTVGQVRAVDGIDLSLGSGECLGVVGESGSGKSTLGRVLLRLLEPTAGEIRFEGTDIGCLREVLRLHKVCPEAEIPDRIGDLLTRVGMSPDHKDRYPAAFSGGQRQRIAIARALAAGPKFIVADEAVSALDVSIQAEVIQLLQQLRRDLSLATLFISHDLSVIEVVADRVLVMYLGRVMEAAPAAELFARPSHPYTRALLSAVPSRRPKPARTVLTGEIPSPSRPPSGCVFRTRCPNAIGKCAEVVPELRRVGEDHVSACIRDDLATGRLT